MFHLALILPFDSLRATFEKIDPIYFWIVGIVIILAIGWGVFALIKRAKVKTKKGRKLSLRERLTPRKANIVLTGDRSIKPRFITVAVQNPGKRPVDLQAPILIFKRWNSKRKFRINSFGSVDDFPIWLEPGYEAKWNVELEQFYERVPELRKACRISAEMKEVSGKKFLSRTIRIKWL